MFYEMSGTVSNLIVNIATKESELVIDNSYFVLINSGVITNVKINAAISFKVSSSAPQSLYVSTCVAENRGTINNLIGNIKITLEGITTTNTTFGGLIALNSGTVNGLETTEDSYIEADTVDVGGLVAANNPEATVSNAINRADVTQISSNESWSPNVGGIIADNRGVLENSSNEGAIKGSSNIIQGETYTPQVIVGGLVAVNRGYIQKSSNKGVVIAESDKANIEIGGIVAENLAYVTGSYSTAQVKATVSYEESFVFIGGLIGHNQGLAANNYSLSQVLSEGVGEERLLQGELIGVCYVGSFQYISNCYYVKEDSVYLGIGGGGSTSLTGYTVYQLTEEQNGMFGVDLNILQDSGVYWQ